MRTTSIGCSSGSFSIRLKSRSTGVCPFFFSSRRRHTRCSRDWSSDVCSSDLEFEVNPSGGLTLKRFRTKALGIEGSQESKREKAIQTAVQELLTYRGFTARTANVCRSEERRVGKECSSGWSRDDEKKTASLRN